MSDLTDTVREKRGFLTIDAVVRTIGAANDLFDAHSLLIAEGVAVGKGNIFYPNVIIERSGEGVITIGNDNVFYPGTYILSSAGSVTIGSGNEFGSGGCTIKANMPAAAIVVGNGGRYCDNTSIMGQTTLGSGSQIIGAITVQSCSLGEGDTYKGTDPDNRAAVLKGFGLARGVTLQKGDVINGAGDFSKAPIERQSSYHPKPAKA